MYRTASSTRTVGFALTTAMAGALLAGCATNAAPPALVSVNKAEVAMAQGKHDKAIEHAEAAVMADPRNASIRATLGTVYMDAGRFAAAATSFDDAQALGDTSARTALSLALALTADGKNREAVNVLNQAQNTISASDLGLAYSLAGQPQRGVHILSNALRNGENTPKVRQNLAYSYALNGDWREARLMASQDVPADKVGDRMQEWAGTITPSAHRARIAKLLDVPADVSDPGQPVMLALGNTPSAVQLASHAMPDAAPSQAPAPVQSFAQAGELPPAAAPQAQPAQAAVRPVTERAVAPQQAARTNAQQFERAFAAPVQSTADRMSTSKAVPGPKMVSNPVVQPLPKSAQQAPSSGDAPAISAAISNTDGTHLVQLGSFSSEKNAQRAWNIYVQRYPELANHQMVITKAMVRGKQYWRVSAAGYDAGGARSMCGKVKSSGHGCVSWAETSPLPGAIDMGTRLARR